MAKRKGNIVDILIIVVILALAALAVYKFGVVNKTEAANASEAAKTKIVTAFVDEVRMPTVNALHEGDKIFDEKTGVCIGTIQTVTHTPFLKSVIAADGSIQQVEYPDYYSVTLTIESQIIEKAEGYFADGVVELKVNSELNTVTKYGKPVIQVTNIADKEGEV